MEKDHDEALRVMPCGTELRLDRPRSHGPLTAAELQFCRLNKITLAYDPVQTGWVPALAHDDLGFSGIAGAAYLRPLEQGAIIRTQLGFRLWALSDVSRYVDLLDDPEVWIHLPEDYPDPLTPDLARSLIELSNTSNHHQVLAVLKGDLPIGQVRLLFGADKTREAEISYWIGRDYWGQGLASAAVRSFSRQSLADHPELDALIARVKNDNSASGRVLQKAGFEIVGRDRTDGWSLYRKARS